MKVIDSWLLTDSYPIVTVRVDAQRDELLISQEPALPHNGSSLNRPFILPLTISTMSNQSEKAFFIATNTVATRASDIIGNDSRLLLNTHGLGTW